MIRKIITVIIFVFFISECYPVTFKFINETGRKIRIKNLIQQDIYRNGIFYKNINSMYKALLEVTSVSNNLGLYNGKYYYYEKNEDLNESYQLKDVYESRFYQDEQGVMQISPEFIMPSLRSIPTFPTNDLKPGDSWKASGEEIHEGIFVKENILLFNINVNYIYLGDENIDNRICSKISIDYHVFHYPKKDPDIFSFTGYSHSIYYWDITNNFPLFYNENYAFMITLHNGETVFYTGTSEGKADSVSNIPDPQKAAIIDEISNKVIHPFSSKNPGISIKETVDGIIVSLGNILFDVNDDAIKKEFEKKLDNLAEVMRKYPQMDILVSGYTDSTGTESYNQLLSENRAKSVSDYLLKKGIDPSRISYIGNGSSDPVAENSTDEGRMKNRRVEIKLLTDE